MKKILFVIIAFIIVGIGVLFTPIGEKYILLPLANSTLSKKIPKHHIVLKHLKLGISSLYVDGVVDKGINFKAQGPVNWIKQHFLLDYQLWAKEFEFDKNIYKVPLKLQGKISGTPDNIDLDGAGHAFEGKLNYSLNISGEKLSNILLKANNLNISQILLVAHQSPLLKGRLNADINIPVMDIEHPKGSLKFHINQGQLQKSILVKSGIDVSKDVPFHSDGDLKMDGKLLKGSVKFISSLINIYLPKLNTTPDFNVIKSDYSVKVPNLNLFNKLAKRELKGSLGVWGKFYIDRDKNFIQLVANTKSIGGLSHIFLNGDKLKVDIKRLSLKKLLYMIGEAPLLKSGFLSGNIDVESIKKYKLNYQLKSEGVWNTKVLKSIANAKKLPKLGKYALKSKGYTKGANIYANSNYKDNILGLNLKDTLISPATKSIKSVYRLFVPNLSKVANLKGALALDGNFKYQGVVKSFEIDGVSKSLGGVAKFNYARNRLKLDLNKINPARVLALTAQKEWLKWGELSANVKLSDVMHHRGIFSYSLNSKVNGAVLKKEGIGNGKSFLLKSKGKGSLTPAKLSAGISLNSLGAKLLMPDIKYFFKDSSLNSSYRLNVPHMQKLQPITVDRYYGPLHLNGHLSYKKSLYIDGKGKNWGGRVVFSFNGNKIDSKAQRVLVASLLKALGYPVLVNGMITKSVFHYDIKYSKGFLNVNLKNFHFVNNPLTQIASVLLNRDLSNEIFHTAVLKGNIVKNLFTFDFNSISKNLKVSINRGKIYLKESKVDAIVSINKKGKTFRFKVKGHLNHPKVTPIMTDVLKSKLNHELKKHHLDKKLAPVEDLVHTLF